MGMARLQLHRNFELCDCVCETAGAHKGLSQSQMALRKIRIDGHRLFIFSDCFGGGTTPQERGGEIKVAFEALRIAGKNAPEFLNRFVDLSLFEKSRSQIVASDGRFGRNFQRGLVLMDGVVETSILRPHVAEIVVRQVVVLSHGQRVQPKRFAVSPVVGLMAGTPRESDDYRDGREGHEALQLPNASGCVGGCPRDRKNNPNFRQIGITVCQRLLSHLHQADYRQEHDDVPTPAGGQIWTLSYIK